jgi:hypothetical protein
MREKSMSTVYKREEKPRDAPNNLRSEESISVNLPGEITRFDTDVNLFTEQTRFDEIMTVGCRFRLQESYNVAISFRSGHSFKPKKSLAESDRPSSRLCGPLSKAAIGLRAHENLRAKSSQMSNFRRRTTLFQTHRNDPPKLVWRRARPLRGISAMLAPSTR